ncbi:MAG TPA: DUF192 domain-containing protein [Candidatus Paceibacterota bacterium]
MKLFYKILIVIFIFGLFVSAIYWAQVSKKEPVVIINDVRIPVEISQSPAERVKGLSGKELLPADSGMLFIFPVREIHRFWMPDMNFPIDIIWIVDNKIVGIDHEVTNVFDPENPIFYLPPQPVDYVLEVNSGFAKNKGLEVGNMVRFQNI